MTHDNRNTESKYNDLHTVNERKNTEITIKPKNQTDIKILIHYVKAFLKKVYQNITK